MEKQSTMIYGIRSVIEAIRSGQELEKVFVQKNLKGDLMKELLSLLGEITVPISKVPPEKLQRLTTKNHQGVVAFVSPVHYFDVHNVVAETFEKGEVPFLLLLDRVTDVRNFGAIARTASASGVHALVIPSVNAAQINADAIKTSAGALATLPVCRVKNLVQTITYLRESGFQVVSCTEKGNTPLFKLDFLAPVALVLGSEEDGISSDILRISDALAYIPMQGEIASLNVSAAAAMFAYEVIRQRAQ